MIDDDGPFYFMTCCACGGRMLKTNMAAIYPAEGLLHRTPCAEKFGELGFGRYPRFDDEAPE